MKVIKDCGTGRFISRKQAAKRRKKTWMRETTRKRSGSKRS
jgi:hypothetical protein